MFPSSAVTIISNTVTSPVKVPTVVTILAVPAASTPTVAFSSPVFASIVTFCVEPATLTWYCPSWDSSTKLSSTFK